MLNYENIENKNVFVKLQLENIILDCENMEYEVVFMHAQNTIS